MNSKRTFVCHFFLSYIFCIIKCLFFFFISTHSYSILKCKTYLINNLPFKAKTQSAEDTTFTIFSPLMSPPTIVGCDSLL